MKVISLLQPWATLVVLGYKKVETRSWNTKHRGPILIHASATKKDLHRSIMLDFQQEFSVLNIPTYKNLPFGAIIGMVNVVETKTTEHIMAEWMAEGDFYNEMEQAFGDYSAGRYSWLLSDPVKFEIPIPYKGCLSIWNYQGILPVL